jgi:hypothetical protein
VREVQAAFAERWRRDYAQGYIFAPGKDHRLASTLAQSLPLAEIERRVENYLAHTDPFYADCKHSFSIFVRDINKFGGPARQQAAPRSRVMDAEASQNYLRDLRERRAR